MTIVEAIKTVLYQVPDGLTSKEIYDEIDQLEKTKCQVDSYSTKYEMYQLFALIAVILLIIEIALREIWLRKLT